jgi:hypothetical protein
VKTVKPTASVKAAKTADKEKGTQNPIAVARSLMQRGHFQHSTAQSTETSVAKKFPQIGVSILQGRHREGKQFLQPGKSIFLLLL